MTTWILEPRDTLLLRDARPSLAGAGALRTLEFPWPSSLAGLLRTRIGTDGNGRFDPAFAEAALRVQMRGPLLVQLDHHGAVSGSFVPAPQDCLWLRETEPTERYVRKRLAPIEIRRRIPGGQTDLDGKSSARSLRPELLIGPEGEAVDTKKPVRGPAFWRWQDFASWLCAPSSEATFSRSEFHAFGLPPLPREQRVHVSIDEAGQTALDGALFTTEMLRFVSKAEEGELARFALQFACDNPYAQTRPLTTGCVTFGGERRLSFLERSPAALPAAPEPLARLLSAGSRRARVVLLTPGLFANGFAPEWIGDERVRVVAAAVQRAQVVSGWDFATGRPKANRRMAPAGSVYWVDLPVELDAVSWLDKVWMQCMPNQLHLQDGRDGFGLCAVGVG